MFGHPPGASQVALPCVMSARGFARGVDVEHDASHLGPIRAVSVGIQSQAYIGALRVPGRRRAGQARNAAVRMPPSYKLDL